MQIEKKWNQALKTEGNFFSDMHMFCELLKNNILQQCIMYFFLFYRQLQDGQNRRQNIPRKHLKLTGRKYS